MAAMAGGSGLRDAAAAANDPRRARRLVLLAVAIALVASGLGMRSSNVAGAAVASYASTVLADGPVGYWRLGETGSTAADSSTGGRPGTYGGPVTKAMTGALVGDPDGAVGFDGTTAAVTITDGSALALNGSFSIEFWAKQRAFVNTWPGILGKGDSSTANGYLLWYDSSGRVRFKRDKRSVITPTGALTTSAFAHFVVTHDGATTRIYVNATMVASSAMSYPTNATTAPLRLGQGDNAGSVVLDEVALYNRALPADAVTRHYTAGTTSPPPPTTTTSSTTATTRPPTTTSTTAAPSTPPSSPRNPSAVPGNTLAFVHWTPPLDAGTSPVSGYTVTASPGGRTATVVAGAVDAVVTGLTNGTAYTFTVTASNSTTTGPASPPTTAVTPSADPMITAAGDIACSANDPGFGGANPARCQMKATSDLIKRYRPAAVLPLGDTQYEEATLTEFNQGYADSWGTLATTSAVHPVAGNHEYGEYDGMAGRGSAPGYFSYFGAAANPSGATTAAGQPAGWYSYDIGGWHLVALNSECAAVGGCNASSPQGQWLASDLAANTANCSAAYFHRPRWGDDPARDNTALADVWSALVGDGVEVALNGHKHAYQRFARLDAVGSPSSLGTRQLVAGTGGRSLGSSVWGPQRAIEEIRDYSRFGVLLLTLHPSSYDWYFVSVSGDVIDRGTEACHGGTAPPPPATSYAATVLADSPLAYWRLGDTGSAAADASGRGLAGTYDQGVTRGLAGALAEADTAAGFNGTGAVVTVADGTKLQLNGPFSIEFWAKRDAVVNRWPGILGKGESWTPNGYLIWYDADGRLRFKRDGRSVLSPIGSLTATYNHFVITYDGSSVRWYVGGQLVSTVATAYPTNATTMNLVLGRGDEAGAVTLDEVAFYGHALPAARVAAHFGAAR